MGDGLGEQESPELTDAKNELSEKIDESQGEEGEEVVQGEAEDVEGVQSDLESFLTELINYIFRNSCIRKPSIMK